MPANKGELHLFKQQTASQRLGCCDMGQILEQECHPSKGSDADRSNLPAMKISNRPRPAGLKHRNGAAMAEQIDVAGDQQQRRRRGPHDSINVMSDNDSSEG